MQTRIGTAVDVSGSCTYSSTIPMQGIIKRLTDRGFGFIGVEGEDKDIFFHAKSLVEIEYDDLREGDAVTFDVEETDKGRNAININRA